MFSHGIMFHHFCDNKIHIKGQGAITGEEFERLLDFYQQEHQILSAEEYADKAQRGLLKKTETCITFDDALKCQFDIAYPILERRGLKAFWFVYTSPFLGICEKLEVYRHFRFSKFSDIEEFYTAFFQLASEYEDELQCGSIQRILQEFQPQGYATDCPFYTPNDKRFRYLRDVVLKQEKYNYLMNQMLEHHHYDQEKVREILWLSKEDVKELFHAGHLLGLHSHTHPTVLKDLSYEEQSQEYGRCKEILESIIGDKVTCVSYPCNSYNSDTLKIMKRLGVSIGFRANMANGYGGKLEMPREDHANIMRRMPQR